MHRGTRRQGSLHAYTAPTSFKVKKEGPLVLLGVDPEPEFTDLAELASSVCWTADGFVTLHDGQWVYMKGVSGRFRQQMGSMSTRFSMKETFCHFTVQQQDVFVVTDTLADTRFASLDLVTQAPAVRFYAGANFADTAGNWIGTVCVTDTIKRELKEWQRRALVLLAGRAAAHVELRTRKLGGS